MFLFVVVIPVLELTYCELAVHHAAAVIQRLRLSQGLSLISTTSLLQQTDFETRLSKMLGGILS